MKNRLDSLDYCKAISIIAVSYLHILAGMGNGNYMIAIMKILGTFQLTMFFIISGIQNRISTSDLNFKDIVIKRIRRLMYPYLTFSLLYIVIDVLIILGKLVLSKNVIYIKLLYDFVDFISTWGIGPLWFLPVMCISDILFRYVKRQRFNIVIYVVITITGIVGSRSLETYKTSLVNHSACFTIYVFDYIIRIMVAFSFIVIGYYIWPLISKFVNRKKTWYVKLIIAASFIIIGGKISIINYDKLDLHFGYLRNPILAYVSSVFLFLGIFIIAILIKIEYLSWLCKYNLIIMGLQIFTTYIVRIGNFVISKVDLNIVVNNNFIFSLIYLCIFIIFASIIVKLVNKYFPKIVFV